MRFHSVLAAAVSVLAGVNAYWLEQMPHQGLAPFAGADYKVFRNVKDYGAMGDGVTDDTAAINRAIMDPQNRCGRDCSSTTKTPAIVYFPSGTYMISSSIVPYYFTQLMGDATSPPVLKATSDFKGFGLIDGNPYYTSVLNWVSVNVFYRQVRNFVIDTTNIPASTPATGMHWPTSQATSLQHITFNMPATPDVVHVGLFIESGSGGFMSDLVFNGGATGASMGNQQYTMRNLTFNNCKTAILHLWDWGWTYMGLKINNCGKGIDISAGKPTNLNVGSLTVIDSKFVNTPVAIVTGNTPDSRPITAGSVVLENVKLENVPVAVEGPSGTVLEGSSGMTTIMGWSQGHRYIPEGPKTVVGVLAPNTRSASLVKDNKKYYTRSKPQYENLPVSSFISVRSEGAVGDATTDDTIAVQSAINRAFYEGKVLFIDYGLYRITAPIVIPAGSKIVGESFPVLMASGNYWNDMMNPKPFIQIGEKSGDAGCVELSDFVVATQGAQPGAILIEYNLDSSSGEPSGMWDVHTRIGGFEGSNLQIAQCSKNMGSSAVNPQCIAAFMSMHVTSQSSGLYMENNWLWTADHDIDDQANTQLTIFVGRGLLIESTAGPVWLLATAVEHHVLYNYQFSGTQNIFGSELQSETPYFQPTPNAMVPFPVNDMFRDPDFETMCAGVQGNCAAAWGLRILDSSNIFLYGSGHYSFFSSYSTACSTKEAGESCQSRIVSLEGNVSNINIFNLNTIGSMSMIDRDGTSLANWRDNMNTFASTNAVFRLRA